MKQINFNNLNERNEFSLSNYIGGIEMEFIKKGKNYLIKNSNGRVVSEEEKIKLENEELIVQDISSNNCQQETTKKIKTTIIGKIKTASVNACPFLFLNINYFLGFIISKPVYFLKTSGIMTEPSSC